ncbi:unnamed protein product [Discosporangium mesarthrocarpum]
MFATENCPALLFLPSLQPPLPHLLFHAPIFSLKLDHTEGGETTESHKAYAISSGNKGPRSAIRLGLLPWAPKGMKPVEGGFQGSGNFIARPDHEIWKIQTAEELRKWLSSSFPQLPLAEHVGDEELERFVSSRGGRFPDPQYCPALQWVDKDALGTSSQARAERAEPGARDGGGQYGVVLLGDAIHAFPPDLGQGVNSALADVRLLEQALNDAEDHLGKALPAFEETHAPDCKALVRLCQIGYPWQYKQPAPVGTRLWAANFALRLLLNKLFPSVFHRQAFMLVQTGFHLRYRDILAKANETTRRLLMVGAAVMAMACVATPPGRAGAAVVAGAGQGAMRRFLPV